MELHAGKVNAIIGENGAGKSTLMKILSGVYSAYDGRIIFKGQPVRFQNTRQAQAVGHCYYSPGAKPGPLFICYGEYFPGARTQHRMGIFDKKLMRDKTLQLLSKLKLSVDPDTRSPH